MPGSYGFRITIVLQVQLSTGKVKAENMERPDPQPGAGFFYNACKQHSLDFCVEQHILFFPRLSATLVVRKVEI